MISYVLVMLVSLATGQPTHAFVEGPMSDRWREQLIQRDGYSGQDGGTLRFASCLRWPDAQLELADNSCSQTSAPVQRTRRQFDCIVPGQAPEVGASPALMAVGARMQAPATMVSPEPMQAPAAMAAPEPMQAPAAMATPAPMPAPAAMAVAAPMPAPATTAAGAMPTIPATSSTAIPVSVASEDSLTRHLGAATAALVTQAHEQMRDGNSELAEETIERALRIEPDNPVLWVELGEVRMSEGDAAQADGTSRRALALAEGDRQVQATAWRLIAESLRARGRNLEAVEADRQAIALAAQ
jgi:hypothetical protein